MKGRFDVEIQPGSYVLYGPCRGGLSIARYEGSKSVPSYKYNYAERRQEKCMVDRPIFSLPTRVCIAYKSDGNVREATYKHFSRTCSTMYSYRAHPITPDMVPANIRRLFDEGPYTEKVTYKR